ncbi:hypothetical protein G6F57_014855 [Rhizopus arrhizus]|uniref:Uncharacterized protein n=1 Tax=Rhizopus oryzae TaxID=64495 RepID=A0A9P7BKL8_RHIOR|nr:hypothetical protein G6F23_015906 [Rhizopus arrhizus]KAG1411588.1 hypothetical protein G6F58_008480 [Rhizopus delemar]KAG0753181.1 hypothetical protein G6F24_013141 [Rhizopus arrhizus]KAG0776686.1 hypothetical protein G6F22_012400 [Rhizopus arrhizus]KAG0779345.1 hypothetical protein G6F21_012625 [Rhizopus arrhizus]
MRLSLISFGLSSVFMIVSSLPFGSVELEKRQILGTAQGFAGRLPAAAGVNAAGRIARSIAGAAGAAGQFPDFR